MNIASFHLSEVSEILQFMGAENRMVVSSGWGQGVEKWELLLNGYIKLQLCKMNKLERSMI